MNNIATTTTTNYHYRCYAMEKGKDAQVPCSDGFASKRSPVGKARATNERLKDRLKMMKMVRMWMRMMMMKEQIHPAELMKDALEIERKEEEDALLPLLSLPLLPVQLPRHIGGHTHTHTQTLMNKDDRERASLIDPSTQVCAQKH